MNNIQKSTFQTTINIWYDKYFNAIIVKIQLPNNTKQNHNLNNNFNYLSIFPLYRCKSSLQNIHSYINFKNILLSKLILPNYFMHPKAASTIDPQKMIKPAWRPKLNTWGRKEQIIFCVPIELGAGQRVHWLIIPYITFLINFLCIYKRNW